MIPQHVAFIMDGNGRWAQQQGLPRSAGHKAGYEHVPDVLEICRELGVGAVSGYAWSTENWRRPRREVDYFEETGPSWRICGLAVDIGGLVA
jgi:undecaprenyl diphosphate synthase